MGLPAGHSQTVLPNIGDQTFSKAFHSMLSKQTLGRNYWWLDNGWVTDSAPAARPRQHQPPATAHRPHTRPPASTSLQTPSATHASVA